MKTIILGALLFSNLCYGNYQISRELVDDVVLTQNEAPNESCSFIKNIYVSVYGTSQFKKNLARVAKENNGNFVLIKYRSPYYSYEFGGELYSCKK